VETIAISGEAPPLVFLHEGLGAARGWRDFPERLCARTGHAGFIYSRRGYGASEPFPGPWPVSFMHDEAALLPSLIPDDAILVGHSDGASIALLHGRARAMVLMAPHVFVEQKTVDSIAKLGDDVRERLRRLHGAQTDATFDAWRNLWLSPEFRAWNIEAAVTRVTCPLLVIQGRDDEYGTFAQVESIAKHARGPVTTVLLDDCGHAPFRDQPGATLAAIEAFLKNPSSR
jgi:pimeloyl-ACP methyl ester carboxylesterase